MARRRPSGDKSTPPKLSGGKTNPSRGFQPVDPSVGNAATWGGAKLPAGQALAAASNAIAVANIKHAVPFLNPDQQSYYDGILAQLDDQLGVDLDGDGKTDTVGTIQQGLNAAEGQNVFDQAQLAFNARKQQDSAQEDAAARGIFQSSIKDTNINDIVAQTKIQQTFLDDRVRNARLAADASVALANRERTRADDWARTTKATNAKAVDDNTPLDYSPVTDPKAVGNGSTGGAPAAPVAAPFAAPVPAPAPALAPSVQAPRVVTQSPQPTTPQNLSSQTPRATGQSPQKTTVTVVHAPAAPAASPVKAAAARSRAANRRTNRPTYSYN